MGISFNSIPSSWRVPLVMAEFDNSQADQGPALLAYRALIIGQKTAGGSIAANALQAVTSADQVRGLAGPGSQLHRMAKAWFSNNKVTEVWIGALADDGAGAAATGTLTVTGPATATGTLALYVHGVAVPVAVTSSDAASAIATNIAAAINANADLGVTASAATSVVTVTAKNKGTCGNSIDLRLNYLDGDATPAGVAVAIVAMASGATDPSLTSLIAAMGDTWFQIIAHPYTSTANLAALEDELASRFGPERMIDGLAITSSSGTQSALATLGESRNSQHSVILAQPGQNPLTTPAEFAAAAAAVVALEGNEDPGRPFQTLPLAGVLAPAQADYFTIQERNLLLFDGVGTTRAMDDGTVQLERVITTYRTNSAGVADTSYLNAETMLTLLYLRYAFRTDIPSKFPRSKLADDGTRVAAGQPVVTPSIIKAEALHWFDDMLDLQLVQNPDLFKQNLVVQRNATDRNRIDVLLPPDIINQLIFVAAQIQFRE